MRIVIPKEVVAGETRVAMPPASVKRIVSDDTVVAVEAGAGEAASFVDSEYADAGAEIITDVGTLFKDADVVLKVAPPAQRDGQHEADLIPRGAVVAAMMRPHENAALLQKLAERDITALSMELMPRTTYAQRMDALSAFSTVAGYSAVLMAANAVPKFFPMLTTAAGTIRPARVFILGAGVAGLQAIATARRLGAVVEAFDIRAAVQEQVESLGATFVVDEHAEDMETTEGYAKEVSEDHEKREQALLAEHIAKSDVVITTALVPGKPAPKLISEEMVKGMRRGSVIVDLAAEAGGNCELTVPDKVVEKYGVTILGPTNLPARIPVHSSQMYGKVLSVFLDHMTGEEGFTVDMDDEITGAIAVTHDGKVRYQS